VDSQVEERIGDAVAKWVDAVRRRPVVVALAVVIGAVGALWYAAGNLEIEGASEQLFAQDLPFKLVEQRYRRDFPQLYENIFVVIDGVTPERASEAATAMVARMQAEPRFFQEVYLPGGGEFFEEHAFLYLETDALEDLADRLAENQPYLAQLSRDGSLHGLSSVLARGVRAVREGDVSGERLLQMFGVFADATGAVSDDRPYHVSWAGVLAAGQIDAVATRRFLVVQPILDLSDLQPAKHAILAIRRIAGELGFTEASGVRVRITGDVALSYEEIEVVERQAASAGVMSFILVAGILAMALRSLRLVLATLFTLLVGLAYTTGFTAIAIGHFNMISIAFVVLFIGLGVDFGIHLCITYRELLARGRDHAQALREASRNIGAALTVCAATTAIGFFAFVPTDFVGVAELGLISGAGMFISLFCTLTLLPALMSLPPLPQGVPNVHAGPWPARGIAELPVRYPRVIRGAALALGVAAIFVFPQARFDNNPLNVRDPSSESVRTFNDLLATGGTSPWSLNVVAPNLEAAQAIAEQLRALDVVGRVVTVSDYIPVDQEEKLGIIEDVAMFIGPRPTGDANSPVKSLAAQVAALTSLQHELEKLESSPGPSAVLAGAGRLRAALDRFLAKLRSSPDPEHLLERLQQSLLGSLPEQLRILNAALGAGHVTLEKLPDALIARMITADGRARIEVFPRQDLNDHAAMAAFVDGVRAVAPEVAGSASEIVESGRLVVRALRQAMLSATALITIFLLMLWRSVNDTALVLAPLGLAAALTVAAAVLFDVPFNFADVIVLPLLLGIGIDSGIHIVHRARRMGDQDENVLSTSTARAVAFSALTTIGSFGTMGLATHLGLATLGQLLTIGVGFTILCNLIVLPSLIVLHAPRKRRMPASKRAA
jgi:hopanoid biosynthesis associated RND transporter like protein HpnN